MPKTPDEKSFFIPKDKIIELNIDYIPKSFEPLPPNVKVQDEPINQKEPIEIDYIPKSFQPLPNQSNNFSSSSKKSEIPFNAPQDMNDIYQNVDSLISEINSSPEKQRAFLSDIVKYAVKAPSAGIGQVLDFLITMPNNALGQVYNATIAPKGYEHQPVPSLEENIEKGVDYLSEKGGLDTSEKTPFYEGTKFATGIAVPGGLAKTAAIKAVPKLAQVLEGIGSSSPKTVTGAFGAGAAMEEARAKGEGAGGQLLSGVEGQILGEAIANPKKALQGIGKETSKLAAKSLGLGRNNLKTEALDAAERLGLEGLPSAAASDSIITGYANQLISKTPIFGDKLRENAKQTSQAFQNAWDKMLDSVAPKIDQELNKEANSIYKISKNLINKEDTVSANLILKKIEETKDLLKSPLHSEPSKKLFSYMNELEKALIPEKNSLNLSDLKGFNKKNLESLPPEVRSEVLAQINNTISQREIPINEILRAKIELNKIMRDKNIFDRTDTDSLGFLKGIQQSFKETLAEYGKKNPKWYKAFEEAESRYAQLAKREDLEDMLSGIIRNPDTGEVRYVPLIKMLEDRKNQKFLKNKLGQQNFNKLKDFVEVARSMSSINKNILNPSGSATVGSVLFAIQALALRANPFPALGTTVGASAITKILTDKKFLNKIRDFAKNPNEQLGNQINNIFKSHFGVGAQALVKQEPSE